MGAITEKRKQLIQSEYDLVKKNALRSISNLHRDLNEVRLFALFAFQEMLDGGGDIDLADVEHIEKEFLTNFPLITALLPMLQEIEQLNSDPTPAVVRAKADAIISNNDLASALESYKQRFEI